jgi:hypothetical protein
VFHTTFIFTQAISPQQYFHAFLASGAAPG